MESKPARSLEELFSNDIASSQFFDISYHNIVTVRSQSVYLNSTNAAMINEIKSISHFDVLPKSPADAAYRRYTLQTGASVQLMNFNQKGITCHFGDVCPAKSLNAKLSGLAQNLDCNYSNENNVVFAVRHYSYLWDYGIGLVTELDNQSRKTTFSIDDVEIQ